MVNEHFLAKTLFAMSSLVVWAVHFLFVYPYTSLACVRGWAEPSASGLGPVAGIVTGATVVALALTGLILMLALRRRGPGRRLREGAPADDFLRTLTAAMAGLSLIAIAWNGLPALIVPPCG